MQDLLRHLTSAYMKCVYRWAGGVRYVITKFSRMDSLPNFVTHGALLRVLWARESSAIISLTCISSETNNFFTRGGGGGVVPSIQPLGCIGMCHAKRLFFLAILV